MKMSDITVGQFASLSAETPGAWVDALETHATRVEDPENLPEGDVDLGDGSPVFELKNGYVETTTGDVYLQKESGAELLFTVDTSILQKNDSSGDWKPYVGPQGGTGWTNGDVVDYESDGPPGEIDQDATEQFVNQLPAEQRQDAREALGIDDNQGEVDGEQSDESGDSDLQYPLDEGDPRRDIDTVEQAQQVAQDFDPDDWEYDNWDTTYQPDIDMVEGQIVEANVDGQLFAMAGDGEPVVVTDPESNEAVTQDGEVIEIVGGQDAENAILAQWNDPATEVARGEKDWSGFRDAVVPDSVQDEIETAEEDGDDESEESSMPDWYDDDPVTERYDESDVDPDLEIEEGRSVSLNGDMVDIGRVQEGEDYTRFNLNDKELGSNDFVVSDGILARRTAIDPDHTDEVFIEFQEESEYEDGWYQIGDGFYQENGSDEYRLDAVTEDGEEVQFEGGFRGKEVDQAFTPVEEHTVETDLEELPEPTGSTDPADWNVDWTNLQEPEQADPDTNRPRLSSRAKEMFMREWKAAVDEEAAESVETVIRSNKNDPFTTESQKFDKLIQEVMGVGGEPRSNGFDDSEEPTEAEVEAMEMFTEASREMFRQNFGESHTAHRGLAGFSHERLMEAIADDFTDTGNASGFEFELEDNPASIWSTDDTAARTFTTVMQDSDSMLKIEKEITPEDVFSMPESVIPFDADDREYDTSSDWDEGEVNIPGDGISLVADDVQVPVLDGGDLTLSDILNHSDDLQQHQEYESVLVDAANMLNSFAPQEVQEQFRENLPDDAPEAAEEWLDREPVDITASVGKEVEKDTPTIDVSDQVPVLRRVRDLEDNVSDVVENADLACKDTNEAETTWKPYIGPDGGTGWTDNEEVVYDDEPPGEIDQEATDEFLDALPESERESAREALGIDEPSDNDAPSAESIVDEVGLEDMDDVQIVLERGIKEGASLDRLGELVLEENSDRLVNRVLKDVETEVTAPVDGFDSEVKVAYNWDDDFDFPQEAESKLEDKLDDEAMDVVDSTIRNWPLDFFSEDTAPLWQTAMEDSGNDNLLVDEEEIRETDVSEAEKEAIREHKQHVEDTLRDAFGDTVTVYRGVSGEAGKQLQDAAENDEEAEWERRALESYTTELRYAKSYAQEPGGVVVEEEVPVEDVWASSQSGFLDANENELVVENDSVENIDPDNIHRPETLDDGEWNVEQVGETLRDALDVEEPTDIDRQEAEQSLTEQELDTADSTTPDSEDEFETFSECQEVNSGVSDSEAYCAVIFGFDASADDPSEGEKADTGKSDSIQLDELNTRWNYELDRSGGIDLARKLDAGYPDAPHKDAPPEVKQAVERWRKEVPESEKEDTALLYWLLGTGTPEYKFGKEDVDYKERPVDGMNCANCEYAYREVVSGKMICSQIRGEVKGEHWCRLWDGADSNTEQKGSRIQKPFAEYEDFSACTQANSDKDDPEAYCAQIHYNVTGEWPSEKHSKSHSITKAEIPEKYLDGTGLSESDFVPNVDVADNCEDVIEFVDEYGMPNPEDQREGINRAHQLNNAAANDEPIAFDYWNEIYNFHKRHRAQNNHECDESSIPDYRYEEVNQNQHDICFFDNGYYSDYTWGSDAGFEQAKQIVEAVESE
jgi:hypothetical protein